MGHEAYLRREREALARHGQESAHEGEAEPAPSLPEAKPNESGVLVSNEAWRRYMRKCDTWETNE